MKTNMIEIDASPWLDENGMIEVGVYIGEGTCEPCFEEKTSLIDLVDKALQAYIVPTTLSIPDYHHEDVELLVNNLKKAYKYAKKQAKNMSVIT